MATAASHRPGGKDGLLAMGWLAMSWLALWLGAGASGCDHGAVKAPPDQAPHDEVWLSPEQMKRGDVRVTTITQADIPQAVVAGGRVAFNDLHVTRVFSPVTGRVSQVLAQPGQRVMKGSPLLTLASPDVGAAFSDVVKASADLAASEAEYHRQARLSAAGASSQRETEQAEDAFHTAKAEYERARKRAALLTKGPPGSAVTQEYTLKSYIDGEVISRSVGPGVEVQGQYSGGTAAELFIIGDIDEVWVYADIPDLELAHVALGADAEIRALAYPGRTFRGRVDWISATVDPVVRTARVRCALRNDGRALKPEMSVTVRIREPPLRRVAVPSDAVVHINETAYVFVADGVRPDERQVFKRRAVKVGDERNGIVPVLEGLNAGERVINEGAVVHEQGGDDVWISREQMSSARITTEVVAEHDIEDAVSVGGRLAFDDLRVSHVYSPVSGRITKVVAALGQHVAKGAPLALIASPEAGTFAADVLKAQTALVTAEHEYRRQKEINAIQDGLRAGTLRDLEVAEDNWRKAQAEVDRARAKTQLLNDGTVDRVTQEYVLRSPIAGEVVARGANPGLEVQGQYTLGSNVAELFTIGATDTLLVLGDVYEMDLPHIKKGDAVTLHVDPYPDQAFHGTVDWISDVLDPTLHTAKVRCAIENPQRLLKPDMYEALRIAVPGKHVLAIPRRAVMRLDNDTLVFVASGQRRSDGAVAFKKRKVIVNDVVSGDLLPVLGGLQQGETVAVDHSVLLLGML